MSAEITRRMLAVLALLPLAAPAQTSPLDAPPPRELIAQADVDDSDLRTEETLKELMDDEYSKKAWSVPKAVALSFLPGAGWGLIYADKKAQATVPFILSAAGYTLAGFYLGGFFDESSKEVCVHVRDDVVGFDECGFANEPGKNLEADPRDPEGKEYFQTEADYKKETAGEDIDGAKTGMIILASTYIGTSLLGAVWSGMVVSDHNDQLRKDIEATVKGPTPIPQPVIAFDGDRGYLGVRLSF